LITPNSNTKDKRGCGESSVSESPAAATIAFLISESLDRDADGVWEEVEEKEEEVSVDEG
jgi:hypothetical protein